MDDKNIHFVVMRLRVNKCEFSVYTVRIFMNKNTPPFQLLTMPKVD